MLLMMTAWLMNLLTIGILLQTLYGYSSGLGNVIKHNLLNLHIFYLNMSMLSAVPKDN